MEGLRAAIVEQSDSRDLVTTDKRQLHNAHSSRGAEDRNTMPVSGNEEDTATARK
jgi:hypothetical protein